MQSHLPKPFPNEPADYREARNQLLTAEADLRAAVEAVAEQRRGLPLGGRIAEDYTFDEWKDGAVVKTRLSELFDDGKDSLILYSYMYGPANADPCPACTSLLDGWNGAAGHIRAKVNLAVVISSPIEKLQAVAANRNWTGLRLLSCAGNGYNRDYLAENDKAEQLPMCTVFVRTDAGIRHFWSSELLYAESPWHPRHLDMVWPLWSIFDLTPQGRGADWFPALSYD